MELPLLLGPPGVSGPPGPPAQPRLHGGPRGGVRIGGKERGVREGAGGALGPLGTLVACTPPAMAPRAPAVLAEPLFLPQSDDRLRVPVYCPVLGGTSDQARPDQTRPTKLCDTLVKGLSQPPQSSRPLSTVLLLGTACMRKCTFISMLEAVPGCNT